MCGQQRRVGRISSATELASCQRCSMSFLPRISSTRRSNLSCTQPRMKSRRGVKEGPGISLPGIHGDKGDTERPRTTTVETSIVLHTPPMRSSRRTEHSPFMSCHFCGREFGSASIGIHERQCQQKLLARHEGRESKGIGARGRGVGSSLQALRHSEHMTVDYSWKPFIVVHVSSVERSSGSIL